MKKWTIKLIMFIVVATMLFAITGCSSDSDYTNDVDDETEYAYEEENDNYSSSGVVGDWVFFKSISDGKTYYADSLEGIVDTDMYFSLEENGEGYAKIDGRDFSFHWEETSYGVSTDGGMSFTKEGDYLSYGSGSTVMYFVKQ